MKIIKRDTYLNQLINLNNTPDIKVITGIRRSGKSVLMDAYIDYIKETEPEANLIIIKLLDLEYEDLREYHHLNEYINNRFIPGVHNLVLIDEVQLCDGFEKVINSIHSKNIFDIYITGSNAFLLSSDLATLFTGRTMEIEVLPFSFSEYLEYFSNSKDLYENLEDYMKFGGMSGSYVYQTERARYDYIKEVYDTIILKDLVKKYRVRNKSELLRITEFMMDNISNLLSPNNIRVYFNSHNSDISDKTVSNYINYLQNAFIFYEAKRYDLKGKKYLESNKKYYLSDHAFRFAVNGTRNMDYGRVYENLVYLELRRRGYDVYVGKLYKKEIDFVAVKQDEKIYIQVSDDISGSETFKREISPLLEIKEAYPKIIIANTRHDTYSYEGIIIYDLAKWLSNQIH